MRDPLRRTLPDHPGESPRTAPRGGGIHTVHPSPLAGGPGGLPRLAVGRGKGASLARVALILRRGCGVSRRRDPDRECQGGPGFSGRGRLPKPGRTSVCLSITVRPMNLRQPFPLSTPVYRFSPRKAGNLTTSSTRFLRRESERRPANPDPDPPDRTTHPQPQRIPPTTPPTPHPAPVADAHYPTRPLPCHPTTQYHEPHLGLGAPAPRPPKPSRAPGGAAECP